jgi:hypothetical protein
MDKLGENVGSIDATLKDIADTGNAIAESLQFIDDELVFIRKAAFPTKPPIVLSGEADWPWSPGTQVQGFLGSRWNRRDGNVYGPVAAPSVIHRRRQ